jgi:O-antigen/teichoic acid export membrane protein
VSSYGLRAQVGGVMTLLNLRLDFMILSLMAGPAVLGIYAIASKYAEFLKIPGVALTYVLYPAYSRLAPAASAAKARVQMRSAGFLVAGAAVPLWFLAGPLIPAIYGSDFHSAVVPARIIVLGLVLEGVAGVITAFLYGIGRPGQNSWAMGAGLAVTVVLDLTLIPHFGATGAAVASAVAYISSTLALIWLFRRAGHRLRAAEAGEDISPQVAELHTQIDQVRAGISKINKLSGVRPGP